MRRALSFALLYVLAVSAVVPSYAQRTPVRAIPPSSDGPVQFGSVNAMSDGNGVLVKWQTTVEAGNIGFFVYRVNGSSRELVNKNIVLGSAAHIARGEALYNQQYQLFDPAGNAGTTYVVESIPSSGGSVDSSLVRPQKVVRLTQSALSSEFATSNAQADGPAMETQSQPSASFTTIPPDQTNQRFVASQPGVKIAVRREGMYRVTKSELQTAGFDVNSNSANWRLFGDGNEQAINVGASNAYVEFYGKPVDTVESETHEYYLINGAIAGKRMQPHFPRAIAGNVIAISGRVLTSRKERLSHIDTIFNGNPEDWYGSLILNTALTSTPTSIPFTVTAIDSTASSATLTVKLNGYTLVSHSVDVSINGHPLGTMTGSSDFAYQATYTFPTSYLVEGAGNTLGLLGAAQGDFSFFDTVSVNFARKFQPDQNRLVFATPQGRKVTVGPFVSPTTSTITIRDGQQIANDVPAAVSAGPGPGALRLGAPAYTYGELDSTNSSLANKARITVYRVFGNTGPVTVDLNLANGTATGGANCSDPNVDYIFPASATVSIADGVGSANVDVQLCKDGVTESPENFTATLSNPTGGATLATNNIRVFDTSYDGGTQQVTNLPITQQAGTSSFKVPAFRASSMYAIDESYELQSPEVIANTPSTLTSNSDATNVADMVIITASTPGFSTAANTWANYRRGQGYTVKVVDVADVMDEFSYGTLSSDAIKSFLIYANTNWSVKPKYVMLLGDATFDPKNYLGRGYTDLIPTKVVTGVFSRMASDEALADFDGDGLAEMAVGRIPVRKVADITTIYNKTVHFETLQTLTRGAVFVYDQPLHPGDDFQSDSTDLRAQLTNMAAADRVLIDRGSGNEGRATTLADLTHGPTGASDKPGPYIANWSGHGSTGLWSNSGFFSIDDVNQVTNSNGETFYTLLTCLNGYFYLANDDSNPVDNDSLAEKLLKSTSGGAAAAWASTGSTTADVQVEMGKQFYKKVNDGTIPRVGDLIKDAKSQLAPSADVRLSWALLGDPLLKMR